METTRTPKSIKEILDHAWDNYMLYYDMFGKDDELTERKLIEWHALRNGFADFCGMTTSELTKALER